MNKEQEYFDNMPESLQGGDKGSAAEAAVDALDSAVSNLDSVDTELDEAFSNIQTAMEG
jgi:exonuclease VII small subunit